MKPAVTDPPEVEAILWDGFGGNVGWDVGANCGQSYTEMTDRFTMVYAFEPAFECWPYLDELASPAYHWTMLALSDVDDTIDLIALPDKINTGQLVTAGTVGMEWNPQAPGATARSVQSRTVDSLVDKRAMLPPDFLKIDVEGHELKVLYGAKKTLALHRPDLLVEFHAPELHTSMVEMLESFGYHVQTIRHPHYPAGSAMWSQHGWIKATQ